MKKGDIVTIKDGSYTRSVVNGKLIHEFLAYGSELGKQYTVIAVGCVLPIEPDPAERYRLPNTYNNTVIQAIDSGKVVFIEECLLRLKYQVPPVREVTMAEVCEQFGESVKIKE